MKVNPVYKKTIKNFAFSFFFGLGMIVITAIMAVTFMFTPVSSIFQNILFENILYKSENPNGIWLHEKIKEGDVINTLFVADKFPIFFDFSDSDISVDIISEHGSSILSPAFNSIDSVNDGTELQNEKAIFKNIPYFNDVPITSVIDVIADASNENISEGSETDSDRAVIESVLNEETAETNVSGESPILAVDLSGQKSSTAQLMTINQTSININLNDYLTREYPIKVKLEDKEKPLVLIICTHATESFSPLDASSYSPAFTGARSSDAENNMIAVAKSLCDTLNENGVSAIQSLTMHDAVSYQNSYTRSLETTTAYLEQYPSIQYVIDVHRDSIIAQNGTKYRPVIKVDGANAAQIMFVVGTPDGGAYHPDWEENLTAVTYLQQRLNEKYPTLTRPVNLREARFNQHTVKGAFLVEMGSCGNSIDEAKYSAQLLGKTLAEIIKKYSE